MSAAGFCFTWRRRWRTGPNPYSVRFGRARSCSFSIASAAEYLRSTCGSDRNPPEFSTHRSVAGTPQVGQATEDICACVRFLLFIVTPCRNTSAEAVQFGTLFVSSVSNMQFDQHPIDAESVRMEGTELQIDCGLDDYST